jgi:hypothetical protein
MYVNMGAHYEPMAAPVTDFGDRPRRFCRDNVVSRALDAIFRVAEHGVGRGEFRRGTRKMAAILFQFAPFRD